MQQPESKAERQYRKHLENVKKYYERKMNEKGPRRPRGRPRKEKQEVAEGDKKELTE